ncbi:MAG: hypothetical protein HETSPECPRED_005477 [Heterodermia speciosa]|uniref:Uncharacterized protein n=1 Tax=Heterodermia speciosa TaxID=116794 RepID=A0A8H3FLC1_9LECA|nr:MAG: hypothetical protein HETSPECPRED_005477 [Heterodermia speciosa]
MSPETPNRSIRATALYLPFTFFALNTLLLILATPSPGSTAPVPIVTTNTSLPSSTTLLLLAKPPMPFNITEIQSPHSTSHLPHVHHLPLPFSHIQKDSIEANDITSGQYPSENAPAAEKKAAENPKMIAVYVVCGVLVLVLGFAVVKALMYRGKYGGYWW